MGWERRRNRKRERERECMFGRTHWFDAVLWFNVSQERLMAPFGGLFLPSCKRSWMEKMQYTWFLYFKILLQNPIMFLVRKVLRSETFWRGFFFIFQKFITQTPVRPVCVSKRGKYPPQKQPATQGKNKRFSLLHGWLRSPFYASMAGLAVLFLSAPFFSQQKVRIF